MTTLAWDGKVLAADRLADAGGYKFPVTKIWRLKDNRLFGWSGDYADGLAFKAYLEDGGVKPDIKDRAGSGLLVTDGIAQRIEEQMIPFNIPEKTATGSGRDYAVAAMHCGKTAIEAIEIAAEYDPSTGMGIDWLCPSEHRTSLLAAYA